MLTNLVWNNSVSDQAWVNGTDIARFGGLGGAVTLGEPITANGLIFNVDAYTIGASVLTLAATTPTVTVTNLSDTATINSTIAGADGLTKAGNGTLVISMNNAGLSGAVAINQGKVTLTNFGGLGTGMTTVGALGTLELNAGVGNLGGSVTLDGGTLTHRPTGQVTLAGSTVLDVTSNGGTVNVVAAGPGGKIFVSAGLLSGGFGATLNKTGAGTFQLAGANLGMFSNVNVTGGQMELQNYNALGGPGGGTISVGGTGEVVTTGTGIPNPLTLNTGGTISANGSGGGDFQGAVNVAGNANVALRFFQATATPNNLKISGVLSGAGNLNVTAPTPTTTAVSSLLLSASNPLYSGTITANTNAQVRAIQGVSNDGLGASAVTLNGGTLGIAPEIIGAGGTSGIRGTWYNSAQFGNGVVGGFDFGLFGTPSATRVDATMNDTVSPLAGRPAGANAVNVGVMWTGILEITPTGSGAYTFSTATDDGSLVYVDGQPVVLNDFSQGVVTRSGVISLFPGFHSIVVKYGQGGGGGAYSVNYSGADTLNATMLVGSVAGTLTSTGTTLLGSSTTDNNITLTAGTASAIDLSATAAANTGTLTFNSNSRVTLTGVTGSETLNQQGGVVLNGRGTIFTGVVQNTNNLQNASAGADMTISGNITENVAGSLFQKSGPRTLTLTGAGSNYTGGTVVAGGTLLLNSAGNAVPGNIRTEPIVVGNGALANNAVFVRLLADNQIPDTASVTLAGYSGIGGGNLDLNGFSDTVGAINFVNNQGTSAETVSTGAGTLTLNGNVLMTGTSTAASQFTGNLNLGGATRTFTTFGLGAPTIGSVITNGSITKAGLGSLLISGANPAYTGLTTVNNGKLSISNAGALGTTGVGATTVVNSGGYLDIVNVSTDEPLTLNGRGQPIVVTTGAPGTMYTGALQGSGGIAGAVTALSSITLGSNVSIGVVKGSALTIGAVIADGGSAFSLTKTQGDGTIGGAPATLGAGGTLVLTGVNTYTGATTIEAGELRLQSAGQAIASTVVNIGDGSNNQATLTLGASNQMPSNVVINFNNTSQNAKFQLNGFNQTVKGFSAETGVNGIIQNFETAGAGTSVLTVNTGGTDTSFNGRMRDQSGVLALTKAGAGTLTLSGINSQAGTNIINYTGATSVTGGTLKLTDATGFNSAITVSGTGALEFNYNYGRNFTYSKALVDNAIGFSKTGLGNLVLTGASPLATGTVNVNAGALVIQGAIGASTILPNAPINVAAGAQLNLFGAAGATSYNNVVTLNGLTPGGALAGAVSGGTIDNTLSGQVNLSGAGMNNISTGWADKTFRITGKITGVGGLQFDKLLYTQQPPVFQINNAANDWSGGTTINAGTVYFTAGLPSTGNLNLGGYFTQSTLNILTGANIVLGTNGLSGFTRAVGTGAGQVSFTGEGGGFSAVGSAQTVNFGGASASVNWGAAGLNAGAALWFNDSNTLAGGSAFNADNSVTVTNDFVLSTGGMRRIYVADNNAGTGDFVIFSGAISGPGGLIKDGNNSAGGANLQGTLRLNGTVANTYTGVTDLIGGVLALNKTANVNAIGGDLQIGGVQNNGTRRIVYLGANEQIPDTATVSMIGSNANNGDLRLFGFSETVGAIQDRSGGGVIEISEVGDTGFLGVAINNTLSSTLTVGGTIGSPVNTDSFYNGFLRTQSGGTGVLNLVKNGSGTLTISQGQQSGAGNASYNGTTTLNGGTLQYSNIGTYNSAVTTAASTNVVFNTNINQSFTDGQTINGSASVQKVGIGTMILGGANGYSGLTTVNGGILQITGAPTGAAGFTVNSGGTLLVGNGTTAGAIQNAGNITVNSGGTVGFSRNNAYTYSGIISGAGNVDSRAGGTATILSGANIFSGVTTVYAGSSLTLAGSEASAGGLNVNTGGTLTLDFNLAGSNALGIVAAAAPVNLNGGTLAMIGSGAANTQTLGAVTLGTALPGGQATLIGLAGLTPTQPGLGASNINLTSGAGGLSVILGPISHTTGGTANIALPALGTVTTSGTAIGGIANGFTTTSSGTTWLAQDGGGVLTALAAFGADTYGAGVNTDVVAGGAGASTNSLRFNTAAATTVTFAGANTIDSGGILVTSAVGANTSTITGGTLAGSATTGLTLIQNNTAGGLTIGSGIVDNGGATGLTKAGIGTVTLTAANTYSGTTYVSQGTLIALGSVGTGLANVAPGATLQVGDGTTNGTLPNFGTNSGTFIVANGTAQTVASPFNANSNFNFLTNSVLNSTSFQSGVFTKTGAGTLTVTSPIASNQFHQRAGTTVLDTGANVVVNGFNSVGQISGDTATLTVKGVGRITDSADFNVGDVGGTRGTLNLQQQGVVSAGNLFVGKFGNAIGVVNQTFGSVVNAGSNADWRIGGGGSAADAAAYGIYNLSAGTFNTGRNFQIGAFGVGVFNQTGGTVTVTGGFPDIGRFAGGNGLLTINNGTFTNTNTGTSLIVGEDGSGTLTMSGGGIVSLATTTGGGVTGLRLGHTATGTGIANLNTGGVLLTTGVSKGAGTGILNLNGGTLRTNTGALAAYLTGLTSAVVYSGGANIDTNGIATTIGQALIVPAGNGLTTIPVGTGGSGYAGEPIVQITGGGGTGATARAIISGGAITGFTITSPGTGYTSAPTVTLVGGGATLAGTAGAATFAANATTGGLTKLNTGVLTLTGANTYGGSTTITGGSIAVTHTAAGTNLILPGNTLVLNGGGLTMTGASALANTQTFASTTISNPGAIVSNITAAGTMVTNLGVITRTVGGAADFSGTGVINTITANTGTSILGGWATFGAGANWAVSAGTGAASGAITALGAYVNDTWAAANNTTVTAATTQTNVTTNSIRFNVNTAFTVTVSGTDVINTGGVLITPTDATASTIFTGGTINTAGTTTDLAFNHFGAGVKTVVSAIGANTGGLVKTGGGVILLSSPTTTNLYTGATTIGGGTLRIGVAEQIPNGSSVTVAAGATFDVNNLAETINGLSGYGTVTSAGNTLTVGSGGASSTFSGIITGAMALTKTGAGTLTFNTLGANTFTGATTISAGAIDIATPNALNNNNTINVNVAGGLLFDTTIPTISGLGGNSTFALQTTATAPVPTAPVQLTVGNNNVSAIYSGALTGAGTLIKTGTGVQVLSGNNISTGGVISNNGSLVLSGTNTGATGSMIATGSGIIGISTSNSLIGSGRNLIVGSGGSVSFGVPTANPASVGFATIASALSLNRLDFNSTGTLALQTDGSLQAPVSENLDFSATGAGGALNLSLGAVLSGPLANATLGTAPVQYTGIITPNANIFRIGGGGGRLILPNSATLAGANSLFLYGGGSVGGNERAFLTGAYGFTGSTTVTAGTTIINTLADGGSASSLGAGGAAASNLVLNGGTLQYVGTGSSTNRLFTISAAPTNIDSSGTGPVSLTGTGAVAFLNSGNRTLTVQGINTGANTIAAAIGDSINIAGTSGVLANGTTAITKNGNGTWFLSGTNTFSGGVTINNGVLGFNSAGAIGANTVNGPATVLVQGGGAAALGGTLTTGIQATLNRISPLSTGTVALTANSSENINLDGGSAGAGLPQVFLGAYGAVNYTGTLTPFGAAYRLGGGGGVLSIPGGGLTGPRVLTIGGGGPGASFVNNPNLNGAVVLGGTSDYTGGTVLTTGGILSATSATPTTAVPALGTGPLKFQGGFYRAIDTTDITLDSVGGTRDIRLGVDSTAASATANIDVVSGVSVTFSKTLGNLATFGSNEAQVTLTKWGTGTLTLANGLNLTLSAGGGTTNSGTLIIERGTLSIASNPTFYNGNIQVGSNAGGVGTLKLGANNVFGTGTVALQGSVIDVYNGSNIDLAGFSDSVRIVRGMGGITNSGAPTANLTVGTNSEVEILGGNLSGNFTLTVGGNQTNTFGASGNVNGLELQNNNNAGFTGKLVANAGALRIRADGSLGSATEPFAADKITLNNGGVLINGTVGFIPIIVGANHGITIGATGGTISQGGTNPMIINSPITGPGRLTIGDETGVVFLANDNNNYSGGTTISSANTRGFLSIGAGGSAGSLPAGDVFFNSAATGARLFFFKSSSLTVPNNINGPGLIFQIGAGTTTLTGNNTNFQTTVVGGGRLRADFSDPAKAPLGTGTALQASGGAFEYIGPVGDNTFRFQGLAATQFSGTNGLSASMMVGGGIGDAAVQSTYGGSGIQQLVFNGNARGTAGVTMNFITSGGTNGVTNSIVFQAGPAVNAPIGAAYYFNGSEFAALDVNNFVRAVRPGIDVNTSALDTLVASQYAKLTNPTPLAVPATIAVSGINLSGGGTGVTVAASATLTLNANPGALLKSGGGTSTVGGGAGATVSNNNQELILRADTAADTLQIDIPLTGTGQLTKSGLGQLTLTAANIATGNNLFAQGTVLLTGSGTLGTIGSPTGEIRIATTAGQTATLAIDSASAGVTMANAANALRVGEAGTGFLNHSNGTVNVPNYLTIGESLGAVGTYNISNLGTLNVKTFTGTPPAGTAGQNNLVVGRVGTGSLNISGSANVNVLNGAQVMLGMGTNNSNQFQGMVPNAASSAGIGTITQTGGTLTVANNNGVYQSNIVGAVIVGVDGAGTYNLNGGTLTTPMLGRGNGTASFNLGGGTLKAATPVATLPSIFNLDLPINLTGTGAGKGTIDTNSNDVAVTSTLTGTGGFKKASAGVLTVLGSGSTYGGGTDITGGSIVASGTSLGTGTVDVGTGTTLTVQGAQQGLLAKFTVGTLTNLTPGVTTGNAAMSTELTSLANFNAYMAGKPMIAVESTAARGKVSVNYLEDGAPNGTTAIPPALVALNNGNNNFIASLGGKFNAAIAGDYTFQTRSDDASALWVDGLPVLDNNRGQGVTTRTGTINLSAGPHEITIAWANTGGGQGFSAGVTLPGQGQSFTIGNELNMSNDLLSYGSNDLTIGGLSGSGTVQTAAGKLNVGSNNSDSTFSGTITGSGGFVKQGTGKFTMSGASAYSGSTVVSAGILAAAANVTPNVNGPFGNSAGAIIIGDAATTANNSSAGVYTFGNVNIARAITVANQATSGVYSIGGCADAISTISGAVSINQPLSVVQVATTGTNILNVAGGISAANAGAKTVTFAGPGAMHVKTVGITDGLGSLALEVSGGVLTISAPSTYSGDTTVDLGATLRVNGTSPDILPVTTSLNVNGTAIIGVSQTLGGLNIGSGAVVTLDDAAGPPPSPLALVAGFDSLGGGLESSAAFGALEAAAPIQGVPEPGTATLLFGGLLTMLGFRRRR